MKGIYYAPIKAAKCESEYDSGKTTTLGGFAIWDYGSYIDVFNAKPLDETDYIFGAIVDDDDEDESILHLIRLAVGNPMVKIIMLQKPKNQDLGKWEVYLGRKCGWKNLNSYDQRIAFGRFVDQNGNLIKPEIIGKG